MARPCPRARVHRGRRRLRGRGEGDRRGALDALGGLDILVNNAGGARGFPEGTASIPDEEWQASFALNLFAAVRLTNALLPALRESKAGAIVNISSGAATMAVGPFAHYCAAKAALDSYSRALAIDLAPRASA